jgi:hypothetical protein
MPYTVCPHPQRHDLDQALLAENATSAALSRKYGPSLSPLWRHNKHLQGKMRQAENRPKNQREISAKLARNQREITAKLARNYRKIHPISRNISNNINQICHAKKILRKTILLSPMRRLKKY